MGALRIDLSCYSRCVHFLLINPAKYAFALLGVGAAYSVANTTVVVGGGSITAAEAAGGYVGGRIAVALTTGDLAAKVNAAVRGVLSGMAVAEGTTLALGGAGAVLGGWALGVEAGCVMTCSVSPCSY